MSGMRGGVIVTDDDLGQDTPSAHEALGKELGLEITEAQYEKFYNTETKEYDFKSHLVEVNFQASQKTQDAAGKADAAAKEAADKAEADKTQSDKATADAEGAVSKAGLDMDVVSQEIIDTGDVSDASRTALNAAGIDDETIAGYLKGIEAQVVVQLSEMLHYIGGDEGLEELKVLVDKAGWSQDKRGEIEVALAGDNWQEAADELLALRGRTEKRDPSADPAPNEGDGFKSQADLEAAIQDPRYRDKSYVGKKYRAEIMAKAAASTYNLNPRAHATGF